MNICVLYSKIMAGKGENTCNQQFVLYIQCFFSWVLPALTLICEEVENFGKEKQNEWMQR